ncbi:hypothetical protein JCGZ_08323 [Jatropha curcas]|uniref:Uncharacterized protein n=1 Tax=Jatropha curcas TaxID=180498 RepID=A0A067KJY5_JATCU|nr:hypothetical protein JCGZ_08323 [Jatropha curcas]
MVRGMAFDSDGSGSGPRGGTSETSSSAQPPVLASLPSVPSSSSPLPEPVESSPASQSTTTPGCEKVCKKQQCVSHELWESWQKAWEDLAFKRKREVFAQKRRSETGGDGAGPSRHTGRSISTIETSRLLAEKYGREPTPMEVFTYTHTKDHDCHTFVDRRALGVNAESEVESIIDELALYLEAIAGEKKSKVYSIGSQASQFYCGSTSYASAVGSGPQPNHSAEEITALRAHVDEQERQLTELRAHVMRMSDQPGAGTSSSDPPPATDQDVSTAQQQPLPSPLDPDTTDDTLVTPADTTTHPAGTPPGDTTLDRADDQPRRFDFGPF